MGDFEYARGYLVRKGTEEKRKGTGAIIIDNH